MIDRLTLLNFSMGMVGMVLTSLGLILSIAVHPLDRWTRNYFIANFSILIIYTTAVTLSNCAMLFRYDTLLKPAVFMESLSSSLLMPMLTVYMLRLCAKPEASQPDSLGQVAPAGSELQASRRRGESLKNSPLVVAVISLWTLYFALLIVTQFTTFIYYIDPEGVYHRGQFYPLLLVPPAAIMLLNLVALFRRWNRLTHKQRHALLIYIAAPLAGMIAQMFFYGLLLVAYGTIIGALAMFTFILSEELDMTVHQARENARKEFGLKVLQMRPHFIYNAMTGIYYLVDTDPKKAKAAMRDFTRYLRQNYNAVVKTEQIPFEEELDHTRAYLSVEQARFGDRLEVTFDTPHTLFRLPPLTLEPIVENAVKHGMDPECDPLRIWIRTRALDGGSEITVENDGADLRPEESDGDSVGLNSVRARLKQMCGGSLTVFPRDGGGAVATLWIPEG